MGNCSQKIKCETCCGLADNAIAHLPSCEIGLPVVLSVQSSPGSHVYDLLIRPCHYDCILQELLHKTQDKNKKRRRVSDAMLQIFHENSSVRCTIMQFKWPATCQFGQFLLAINQFFPAHAMHTHTHTHTHKQKQTSSHTWLQECE